MINLKVSLQRRNHPAIRRWANKNGYEVADYGPIAWHVMHAFQDAHDRALAEASKRFLAEAAE